MAVTSPAKARVIDFVKTTGLGEQYSFEFEGSESDARKYVHNMRVHLSRMRDIVRSAGGTVLPFKMKLISIERIENSKPPITIPSDPPSFQPPPILQKVTLEKSDYDSELHSQFADVFSDLSI